MNSWRQNEILEIESRNGAVNGERHEHFCETEKPQIQRSAAAFSRLRKQYAVNTDARLLAFIDALGEALGVHQGPGRRRVATAAARRAVALLAPLLSHPASANGGKRGRPVKHDREFAADNLLSIIAHDPDGLQTTDAVLVRKLRRRFEDLGNSMPGTTWLKEIVAEVRGRALIQCAEAAKKWHASEHLQSVFEAPDDFAFFCRSRDRLEEKWHRDTLLQARYPKPSDFIASSFKVETLDAIATANSAPCGTELASITDQI